MAPDRRLVDEHQVELARQQCQSSIEFLEQELGLRMLRPPQGRALIRRLAELRDQLQQLEEVLAVLAAIPRSEDRPPPG